MKNIIYSILGLSFVISFSSCNKEENLNVDMSSYNYDDFEKLPIDDYIYNNLTKPFNVEVVYRFDRSHTDIGKNISPPKIEQVQPAVDMVLDGFIRVYDKVAGPTFIKTYTPKQFVLFGSHAYNSNGTVTLGTADGGRRVVLYDINNINPNSSADISRRLQTIHHEFTHILNQIVAIPSSFRTVTTDYVADWTASSNTAEEAQALGFISQYSRSSFPEDFAETVAHLLIKGQVYYDLYASGSTEDGSAKLKLKQSIVEDYFKQFLNIDFKELQYEVHKVLVEQYADESQLFITALKNNNIESIGVDMDGGSEYSIYGKSAAFDQVWQEVKQSFASTQNGGFKPGKFSIVFQSSTRMQIQAEFPNSSGSTTYLSWYDFDLTYNSDGTVSFKYIDEGKTGTGNVPYDNGRFIKEGWQPLLDYFQNNIFTPEWVSPEIVGFGNLMKFGGLNVEGEVDNYIYGPVTLK